MSDSAGRVVDNKDFDSFLDDAVYAVHKLWRQNGGHRLDTDELCDLNDTLSTHFYTKRFENTFDDREGDDDATATC